MRTAESRAPSSQGRQQKSGSSGNGSSRKRKTRRDILRIERLEDRLLFTVTPFGGDNQGSWLASHGNVCSCPLCTGVGLDQIPAEEFSPTGTAQAPLSALPQLHSNAGATAKLFLDFDGRVTGSWGFYTNVNTPVYSQDADLTTYSDAELSAIYEIWARVAEDYAPFNIDVTTVDPGSMANGVVAVIAIGGSYSDWYGSSAGGVAYIGGFYNASPNTGFVFEDNLSSNSKYIAEAASHEAGHLFGLQHQAKWSGTTLVESYHSGTGSWAPIMGVGYYVPRTTWHNGATSSSSTSYQDDLAILSGASNGFGYKADDFGGTTGTASGLPTSGTSVNFSGLIGLANDLDVWSFTTTGGSVTFQLAGAQYGSNLDAVLELWDSSGATIVSDAPSGSQGASLTTSVGAGTYYLVARGVGDYGDVGQYTITGSIPAASAAPEIHLSVSGVAVADGGALAFGTTTVGSAVNRTVTVTNQGSAVLTLTSLNAGSLPVGFTLVSNLGATSLNAGQSTTFVVRLDAAAAGTFSGSIQLANSDGDENPYDVTLSGTVTAPEIAIAISGSGVADGQTVLFGSTAVGTSITRVFTVTNTGSATLTLTNINAGSLPTGFTLVSNLGSTSLAAGQSTTFSIRLDATAAGSFGGAIQLLNNDGDENPYDLVLSGTVNAPEINVALSGSNLTSGQTIDFGATTVGQVVNRTFTITNTGSAILTLSNINGSGLPSGFALVSNLGSTTLAAGQSTTFCIQLAAGGMGSYSGSIQLANNDTDESPFVLALAGVVQAPEIHLSVSGVAVADGGALAFGTTTVGSAVNRTVTVTNQGSAVLTLTSLNAGSLPVGFTLVSNLGATSLNAGQSTMFVVRLDAAAAGTFSGSIQLANSDGDENPYDVTLSGTVTAPEIAIAISGSGVADGQTVLFGSTAVGTSITRVFTVTNTGSATLTLTNINAGSLPTGFTLVSNLGSTSLAAGQSTTFSIRLDATAAGSFGGAIQLLNNDGDENPYDLVLSGTVNAPEINVALSGSNLTSGQTIDFGATTVGQVVNRTFTITNTGSATLTLSTINGSGLPSGFALVSNLGSTTLAAGQSTTFCIQLAAGGTGSYSGSIQLANNDTDESPFVLALAGVVQAPEIKITLGGANVADGQLIDFGGTLVGSALSRTFTVTNEGTSTLTLTLLNPNALPTGFTLVSNLATTTLAAGQSTTFTVRFDATTAGSFGGTISLVNSDGDESPFDLQLQATASVPTPADVGVSVAGQELSVGQLVNFGVTVTGYTLERTFWIRNDGESLLTLNTIDPSSLPPGFSLLQDLTATSLAPGETASFILRLDAQAAGVYSGQFSILSNDADGPFTVQVSATVADPIPPLVSVLDNGDFGTSLVGGWKRITGKGNAQDIHTANKGQGAIYSWSFGSLPQAQYHVWATWTNASTNASNAPYSLRDGGSLLSTVKINQRVAPSGLTINGTRWKSIGTVYVSSGTLVVKLSNAANGQVVADAIRIERVITLVPPSPEICVSDGISELASASSTSQFGFVELGNSQTRTFTVTNHGTGSLTLTPLDPASLPAGFTLLQNLGTTYLTPGESTTFVVELDADAAGAFAGTICVESNDSDEPHFGVNVAATVYDPSASLARIIEDATAGNSRVGSWTRVTTKGYAGDQWTANTGNGGIYSKWDFGNLPPGEYRVQATWKTGTNYATNAPFLLHNGGQLVSTVRVNQRLAPGDVWDGGWWKNLGTVTVTGNQLFVKLTNSANGLVVADAIRIERVTTAGASLPAAWLTTMFASQDHSAPDALPLPANAPVSHFPVGSEAHPDTLWQTLNAAATEPEERLLADVLDLLAHTRQARSSHAAAEFFSSHDLALGSLFQPLV